MRKEWADTNAGELVSAEVVWVHLSPKSNLALLVYLLFS